MGMCARGLCVLLWGGALRMIARCDKCGVMFDSHDGGAVVAGVTYCPKCEEKYEITESKGGIMKKGKRILVDVTGTNWKLLRKQKIFLLSLDSEEKGDTDSINGLVHFIDHIQDSAAEQLGEVKVFLR